MNMPNRAWRHQCIRASRCAAVSPAFGSCLVEANDDAQSDKTMLVSPRQRREVRFIGVIFSVAIWVARRLHTLFNSFRIAVVEQSSPGISGLQFQDIVHCIVGNFVVCRSENRAAGSIWTGR